ncbi:MAG TPA: hypothetical protein DCF88_09620 [Plesiomonas shigelloides]|nr:hypothetical protein [Plesiomonas shigelloides]
MAGMPCQIMRHHRRCCQAVGEWGKRQDAVVDIKDCTDDRKHQDGVIARAYAQGKRTDQFRMHSGRVVIPR